jgi:inhibitor of cysteine peptidase
VYVNGTVTATWSGTSGPSGSNWLGLFKPGDPSTGFYLYGSGGTNVGVASGSSPFTLPAVATPGTYELRLFAGAYTLLATSNPITVVPLPTITGTLALGGSALSNVAIAATNGVTCTILTNAVTYSCTVPPGWSGSVTPSRGGVSFTPASRSYTNVTSNQTAQDYPATSTTTLSVSPTSVLANSTVTATWSGTAGPSGSNWMGLFKPGDPSTAFYNYGSSGTNLGVASGSSPFTLPAAAWQPGNYEIRLFAGGYTLLATSNPITVVPPVTVSGTVTLNGSPLSGVAFTANNGGTCTASNSSGNYTCTVVQGWSGSVTPSHSSYAFTPASRNYSNVTANQTAQNYTATPTFQLSGTVTVGGSPLAGVAFAATNGGTCTASNASGQYSCTVLSGWSGTVTPSLSGYVFAPVLRDYAAVTANQTAQNYAATATYQVSGTVTVSGSPLAGVLFTASNSGTCTTSNAAGQYNCTVLSGWSGTVTPSLAGYGFTPASRSYSSVVANQTGQDFVGTVVSTGAIYFIHPDHLNTPRMIADAAGMTVWKWDQQEPFGSTPPNDNPSGLGAFDFPLRFPGQYFDRETGLAYNVFRDYDSAIGRYIQVDPIGTIGILPRHEVVDTRSPSVLSSDPEIGDEIARASRLIALFQRSRSNPYAYVDGNPLGHADPEGLMPMVPGPAPSPSPSSPSPATQVCFVPCPLKHVMILNGVTIGCIYKCFDGTIKTKLPVLGSCPESA